MDALFLSTLINIQETVLYIQESELQISHRKTDVATELADNFNDPRYSVVTRCCW